MQQNTSPMARIWDDYRTLSLKLTAKIGAYMKHTGIIESFHGSQNISIFLHASPFSLAYSHNNKGKTCLEKIPTSLEHSIRHLHASMQSDGLCLTQHCGSLRP